MQPAEHTFLFMDLVGYTAFTDAQGDDRAADVASTLQREVRALLPEYHADEVKALGDGVMLRVTDPAAAVLLALRIVDQLGSDSEFPAVRVGIHTGPAVSRDGDWYGRTVNVAARLCSVAPGGEVLVSDATRQAAGGMKTVEFGERQLHWLRNVTEPVATYSARERPCALRSARAAARAIGRRRPRATRRAEVAA